MRKFDFNLKPSEWWKKYFGFYAAIILLSVLSTLISSKMDESTTLALNLAVPNIVISIVSLLVTLVFQVFLIRVIISHISVCDSSFSFEGTVEEFLKINITGILLSVITLGVYLPWYYRNVVRFYYRNTYYKNIPFEFRGKAHHLLIYIVLALFVPVLIAVFGVEWGFYQFGFDKHIQYVLFGIFLLIIVLFFQIFLYRWLTQGKWETYQFEWDGTGKSAVMIQTLLGLVTAGLYLPAAFLKIYKIVTENIHLKSEYSVIAKLQFDGDNLKGFLLFWKNLILIIITFGFYVPWGGVQIIEWFISNTRVIAEEETEC